MSALVSVVIPVYNGSAYLRRAIESVLEQTYQAIEVVVVDDGSVDDSAQIIASYGPRLKPIHQQNAGVSQARNAGIRAAHGEFVAFLDQDDWWLPTKVAKQVKVFRQDDEFGLAHTGVAFYHEPSDTLVGRPNALRPELLVGRCYERLLLGNAILNSSVMVRKSVLNTVGILSTEIRGNSIQDYDLWLRIARHSSFGYVSEELVVYRLHAAQGMWDARLSLVEEERLLERILGETRTKLSEEMRVRMARLLDEVGVAHLDASDIKPARRCFAKALGHRFSLRDTALLGLTYLPTSWINHLRRARTNLQSLRRPKVATRVPWWASLREN
jgi:glycosyltransferase involved in cell wall biosynthesis